MIASKPNACRVFSILTAVLLLAQTGACKTRPKNAGGDPAPNGARPAEVLSWRHQILAQDRYVQLAGEWEAYSRNNPRDARALIEWGDALRYSGKRDEAIQKYTQAYEAAKDDPAAITALMAVRVSGDPQLDWGRAHEELLRATRIDPDYPETYYTLWLTSIHQRDPKRAETCLRRVVELGDMPQPLLDYAFDMLVGAPREAILFTNGDNDTYPPCALQAIEGLRTDVTIVNISLLNTTWYIRNMRDAGLPIGLDDDAIDALAHGKERSISAQVQQRIFDRMGSEAHPRPMVYSLTVFDANRAISAPRILEGIFERVVTGGEGTAAKEGFDLDRTRELFDTVYRIDGFMDPTVDWERESSVAHLAINFIPLLTRVGTGLLERSPREDGSPYLARAVRLASFLGEKEQAAKIVETWQRLDPESPSLAEVRQLVEAPR